MENVLTVGAEETLKLGHQADQVELPQEALVLHSCIQPHDKTTGEGCELSHTHTHRHTV